MRMIRRSRVRLNGPASALANARAATTTFVALSTARSTRTACLARLYGAYANAQRDYQRKIERVVVRAHDQMPSVSTIQHAVAESASTMSHASSKLRLAIRLRTHRGSANTSHPTDTATSRRWNTLGDDESRVVVAAEGRMTRKEDAADTSGAKTAGILAAATECPRLCSPPEQSRQESRTDADWRPDQD